MDRVGFGRVNAFAVVLAAVALSACAGGRNEKADLPDSAMLEVPADPAGAPQPARTDTLTPAAPSARKEPATTPRGIREQPVPERTDGDVRQPAPARDTRPSIPWPPDTL